MIRAEDVKEHLDTRPFEPFRIVMTDGKTYDVTHPDLCIISRSTLYVGHANPRKPGVAAGVDHCALVHIVRFEPLNGDRGGRSGRRKTS